MRTLLVTGLLLLTAACAPGMGANPLGGVPSDDVSQTPPEGGPALQEWLLEAHHEDWTCQSGITDPSSLSIHGRKRVCFNDALKDAATTAAYPVGVAAVKELYDLDDQRIGTVVVSKVTADNWYWYEEIGDAIGSARRDDPNCASCHQSAPDNGGHEFIYNRP